MVDDLEPLLAGAGATIHVLQCPDLEEHAASAFSRPRLGGSRLRADGGLRPVPYGGRSWSPASTAVVYGSCGPPFHDLVGRTLRDWLRTHPRV
jgi:hypothetical protein